MQRMEIMAPGGSLKSCLAAARAGADAVYLGFGKLNARRPADNFDVPGLKKITDYLHAQGKKVYLTLNIDFKSKELYEVLQLMTLCAQIHIDAVIVKDPALILLYNRYFKGSFELHLSTQTAITASPGAKFARTAGVHRIVLARELTLEEIRQITPVLECEIFTEGSMCFSISGRCLMSSWVGGRSGNRGACTAPCRINWEYQGNKGPIFAMKDLSLVTELKAITEAGVKALKIEGRLKNAAWVETITGLYKKALEAGEGAPAELIEEIRAELARYSAREIARGHLYGHTGLTGPNQEWEAYKKEGTASEIPIPPEFERLLKLEISAEKNNLACTVRYENFAEKITLTLPAEPKKAKTVPLEALTGSLAEAFKEYRTAIDWNAGDIQVKSSQLQKIEKNIITTVEAILRKAHCLPMPGISGGCGESGLVKEITPEEAAAVKGVDLKKKRPRLLGGLPDRLIIRYNQLDEVLAAGYKAETIVIELQEGMETGTLLALADTCRLVLSLPDVLFEQDIPAIDTLISQLIKAGCREFEANSLTGFQLLGEKECIRHAGPGYPVFNHLAAEFFHLQGLHSVYAAPECEASVYKALDAFTGGALNVLAFARLPLFISRTKDPAFTRGALFKDRIGIEVECFCRGSLSYFVSTRYFSLLGEKICKEGIRVDSAAADLRYFSRPGKVLKELAQGKYPGTEEHTFNFFSKLV